MSTRNFNQKAEYLCQKKQNKSVMDYHLNSVFSEQPTNIRMLAIGGGPTKMSAQNLSHNYVDIESKLRNIKANNLEGTDFNPKLSSKQIKSAELFNNRLRQNIYLPPPMLHHDNQRPGFHNI